MADTRWTCETASLVFCWQTPGETSHADLAREDIPNQVAQARTRTVLGTPTTYRSHLSVSRVIIQDEHRIGGYERGQGYGASCATWSGRHLERSILGAS